MVGIEPGADGLFEHGDGEQVEVLARESDRRRGQSALTEHRTPLGWGRREVGSSGEEIDEFVVGPGGQVVGQTHALVIRTHSIDSTGAVENGSWHNERVAENKHVKKKYVDNGWPDQEDGEHVHAVSEFAANLSGALSPFGDVTFPLPVEDLPFVQSKTVVNR